MRQIHATANMKKRTFALSILILIIVSVLMTRLVYGAFVLHTIVISVVAGCIASSVIFNLDKRRLRSTSRIAPTCWPP